MGPAGSSPTPAEGYDRYTGRYGQELAIGLLQVAGVADGQRALDVGCGPGALTTALVDVLGPDRVSAVDRSEAFVVACRARTAADVRVGDAQHLPFPDGAFDVVLSQLVVNLLGDPLAGVREMARVARPGGVVASSVWDDDVMPLLRAFWDAAALVVPEAAAAVERPGRVGCREGELAELWQSAGLGEVSVGELTVTAAYEDFDDLWAPLGAGVGQPGALCRSLDRERQEALRAEVHRRLGSPAGGFRLMARAWSARGVAPVQPVGDGGGDTVPG